MKHRDEVEEDLTGPKDMLLVETENTCVFVKDGQLFFAYDLGADGWFCAETLCECTDAMHREIIDALTYGHNLL